MFVKQQASETYSKKRTAQMRSCRLLRISPSRRLQCKRYYELTLRMAAAGLTHVGHLLTGTEPGQRLRWLTHKELVARCKARGVKTPCTPAALAQLHTDMPPAWQAIIQHACNQPPHQGLASILGRPTPGIWYRSGDRAGLSGASPLIHLPYRVSPIGVLTHALSAILTPASQCTQIHVWLHQRLAHNDAERKARSRALARGEPDPFPATLLTSGSVADTALLGLPSPSFPVGANPAHFCLTSAAT